MLMGTDLFGNPVEPVTSGKLADDFIVPPFSVLNAREGAWQERKRAWLSYGIKGEVGRDTGLIQGGNAQKWQEKNGPAGEPNEWTSIFDPVLCEVVYRWFTKRDAQIVDPFAGGSVRGIVASLLGRKYWGCDLRAEQVTANEEQARAICGTNERPRWEIGDARDVLRNAPIADLIFSCPPYGDLERYSDDPRDLSAMAHHDFRQAYYQIIKAACERLAANRFACFVVGDFRDPASGFYRNFLGQTIAAFEAGGCRLYNEIILITSVGSLPVRAGKQFRAGRKVGKSHQNVLVFVKGDGRAAADACGPIAKEYDYI